MGSIIFTSVGWFVHSGKLLYGNDFFKRPCSIIKIILIETLRFYDLVITLLPLCFSLGF